MARQERLAIKFLCLGVSILVMVACHSGEQPHKIIPSVFVRQTNETVKTKQGILYYQDRPFSGWQYDCYANGDTSLLVPFFQGKEHGRAQQWYANGALREQRTYELGNKVGEHKGWWENGKPAFLYHFQNGLHEGNQKEYSEVGRLFKNSNYKAGKEEGLQQIWRYDGSLVANYVAKNGRNYGLAGVKNCKSVWEDEKKN